MSDTSEQLGQLGSEPRPQRLPGLARPIFRASDKTRDKFVHCSGLVSIIVVCFGHLSQEIVDYRSDQVKDMREQLTCRNYHLDMRSGWMQSTLFLGPKVGSLQSARVSRRVTYGLPERLTLDYRSNLLDTGLTILVDKEIMLVQTGQSADLQFLTPC